MVSYVIESEAGRKWLPSFHHHDVEGGIYIAPEEPANLVLLLASGKVDHLSGRFFGVDGNMDQMMLQAEHIAQDDLYTLRVSKLPPSSQ
jgi:hypothetical protein